MNIRCPGCGATAEYSVSNQKMTCVYCGLHFTPTEADGKREYEHRQRAAKVDALLKMEKRSRAVMEMHSFHCTACGATLLAKDREATSYCQYCGQAAVLEEQISDYLAPDFIIPFKVTQEEAAQSLKKELRKGLFIPARYKKVEINKLTPIYVPYWVMNLYYEDYQRYVYYRPEKNGSGIYYASVGGKLHLDGYAVDGSKLLDDRSASRIGPFDLTEMEPFDPAYLSGYYADRFDEGIDEVESFAIQNVRDQFDAEMQKRVMKYSTEKVQSRSKHRISNVSYALLPVWFLNITVGDRVYTMLVNGQTGKAVASIPVSYPRIVGVFTGAMAAMTALCIGAFMILHRIVAALTLKIVDWGWEDGAGYLTIAYVIAILAAISISLNMLTVGTRRWKDFRKDLILTNGDDNLKFVKDRGTEEFQ